MLSIKIKRWKIYSKRRLCNTSQRKFYQVMCIRSYFQFADTKPYFKKKGSGFNLRGWINFMLRHRTLISANISCWMNKARLEKSNEILLIEGLTRKLIRHQILKKKMMKQIVTSMRMKAAIKNQVTSNRNKILSLRNRGLRHHHYTRLIKKQISTLFGKDRTQSNLWET